MKQLFTQNRKWIAASALGALLLAGGVYAFAQTGTDDGDKKTAKGKIRMVTIINGDTLVTEKDFPEMDEEKLKISIDSLREQWKGLDLDFLLNFDEEAAQNGNKIIRKFNINGRPACMDSLSGNFDIRIGSDRVNIDSIMKTIDLDMDIRMDADALTGDEKEGNKVKRVIIKSGNGSAMSMVVTDCGKADAQTETKVIKDENGNTKIIANKMVICITDEECKPSSGKGGMKKNASQTTLKVEDLTAYPNPSNGQITVKFNLSEKGDAKVTVTDVNGREIYKETLKDFSGTFEKQLDLQGADGIYFLKVEQNGKRMQRKIVKEE